MISILAHCGYLSETSRMIEIHRALTARGAAVRMATHGGVHERLLTAAGIDYDLVGPRLSAERSAEMARTYGQGSIRQDMYTDAELRAYVQAEAAYFRDSGTSVAVTGITVSTLLSTRLAGARLATEHAGSFVPPVFERGLLPAPSTPPVGPVVLPRALARAAMNRGTPWLRWYCGNLRRLAAELGVETVPGTVAMLLGDLTLVPEIPEVVGISAAELEAWRPKRRSPYRPGTRLRYTGPLFAHFDLPVPAEVERFLAADSGPVVYVALCSTGPDLVRDVVRALAAQLDARILVAGTVHDTAELRELSSEHVHIAGTLPSHLIMPRVDLAVVTGGQGSVQTAMAAGTPIVGVPLQPEQDLNVALVERLGAARLVSQRNARTPKVAEAARAVLTDPSYRQAARRVQGLYDAVDGPANAAEAITEFAAEPALRG
jgi:UDP:flavonoid glycosyltransferase YjiC (YdhE family)